ncbi:MAG: enoyl-CoA hydratase/isomerase, partial [Proteobacteria bacterium]|nr:enoyl-CoA hydratase/isomerase [Pseudomonadota bacterium]
MKYKRIKVETKGNVAMLTLDHQEVLNAISPRMLNELKVAIIEIAQPTSPIRSLLITGAGRGFCSGANLSDREPSQSGDGAINVPFSLDNTYNPLFMLLKSLDKPIITAINGPAAGVGMSLALMGDLVLAGRSAYFLQAFRRVGLVPDGGITWLLPRLIGLARAMELSLLAEKLPAEKALEWGLINRIYADDNLIPEALKLAENLAAGPTVALGLMRKSYWQSVDNSHEQQLHLESLYQQVAGSSEDALEGRMAFLEKR